MTLEMKRFCDDGDTSGTLFYIDGVFECFMVEDQEQKEKKVYGETRIPNGEYDVSIRNEGRLNGIYNKRFDWHDGMLCIHNAPNWKIIIGTIVFQYVMFHPGNTDDHTLGCPLPNETFNSTTMKGSGSTVAYKRMYQKIMPELRSGGKVKLIVTDIEHGK